MVRKLKLGWGKSNNLPKGAWSGGEIIGPEGFFRSHKIVDDLPYEIVGENHRWVKLKGKEVQVYAYRMKGKVLESVDVNHGGPRVWTIVCTEYKNEIYTFVIHMLPYEVYFTRDSFMPLVEVEQQLITEEFGIGWERIWPE